MTYQEAIERIKRRYTTVSMCINSEECRAENEAISMAIGALERQVPKKPTHVATLQSCNTCPCCGQVIDTKVYEEFGNRRFLVVYQRCVFCGQAIDWGN